MFYVYILCSLKTGKLYYGYSEDVLTRLSWHNAGTERYTKSGIPWELLHQECYKTKGEALKREKYLKKLKNPKYVLENIVRNVNSGDSRLDRDGSDEQKN